MERLNNLNFLISTIEAKFSEAIHKLGTGQNPLSLIEKSGSYYWLALFELEKFQDSVLSYDFVLIKPGIGESFCESKLSDIGEIDYQILASAKNPKEQRVPKAYQIPGVEIYRSLFYVSRDGNLYDHNLQPVEPEQISILADMISQSQTTHEVTNELTFPEL